MTVARRRFLVSMIGAGCGSALPGCGAARLVSDSREAAGGGLRALRVDHDLCIGCRLCESACHLANGGEGEEGGTCRSLIHVHAFAPGPYHVAWACLGCPDVPCVRACDYYASPLAHRKALHIHEVTGAVSLERDACAGCERCIQACERDGGAVLRWDDDERIVGACHLCGGAPSCAEVCPTGAISITAVAPDDEAGARAPEEVASVGIARLCRTDQDRQVLRRGEAPLRALAVDADRCIGCRLCECACDEQRNRRVVDGRELPGIGDPSRALITVHAHAGPYYVPWACPGCPDLPCVAACRAETFGGRAGRALFLDPDSCAVGFEPGFCTACMACVDACEERGGGVLRWDQSEMVTGACTLCGGEPACVRECPVDALKMVDVDRLARAGARRPEQAAREGWKRLFGRGRRG